MIGAILGGKEFKSDSACSVSFSSLMKRYSLPQSWNSICADALSHPFVGCSSYVEGVLMGHSAPSVCFIFPLSTLHLYSFLL